VPGPDLQIVRQGLEAFYAVELLLRSGLCAAGGAGGLLQQIRPAHIAHEEEVPRENPHRLIGARGVSQQQGDVLRRVPRRVQHLDANVADHPVIALGHENDIGLMGEGVLPIGVAHVAEKEHGARSRSQLTPSAHIVGVNVGLCDVGDAQPLLLGGLEVLADVSVRVYDQRLSGLRAADQIGGLRQVVVVEVLQQHIRILSRVDAP